MNGNTLRHSFPVWFQRLPVRARVQPSNAPDKAPSLLSSTARKILDSLQSSTSPLKDVRRMPIRQLSDDDLVSDGWLFVGGPVYVSGNRKINQSSYSRDNS